MTLRTRRRALAGVLAAAALAVAAAPAGASSIVFVKDGNVWLTDPDGARQYQVTFDGGYLSPSQADDGTIVAWRAKQFVRMDRSGRVLNPPVDGIGRDDGGGKFYGPWEPKVSPDGRRIAYWFGEYTSRYSYGCYCYLYTVESRSTWTWADHFKPFTDGRPARRARLPVLAHERPAARDLRRLLPERLDLEARQRPRQPRRAVGVHRPAPGRRLLRPRRRRGQPRRLALRGDGRRRRREQP